MSHQSPFVHGWNRDLPDRRDFAFSAPPKLVRALNPTASLVTKMPAVIDQGSLGSCTGCASVAMVQYVRAKQLGVPTKSVWAPSRLFAYYNARRLGRTLSYDSGASIRDVVKGIAAYGAVDETMWPYVISKFAARPPALIVQEASRYQAISYQAVSQDLNQMRGCLAEGYPFIIGVSVYDSFLSEAAAGSGTIPLPSGNEALQGGHAILVVGYSDITQRFTFRNSWGAEWGRRGYGTLPYSYLTDTGLAGDFWTIRSVEA